jgi:isocitrate dehydrogenase (NAD+)
MSTKITLIPGDGIGPEVISSARRIVDEVVDVTWEIVEAGESAIQRYRTPLPDHVIESVRKNKIALKGPITTPVGSGFRSVNVEIRKRLDLFANVRPAKSIPYLSKYNDVDLVIVRENTEDLYAGIEFEVGKEETKEFLNFLKRYGVGIKEDSGISIKPISISGSERIVDFAFRYAENNHRKKVTAVHKANIMKFSDGLFLNVARKVAERYNIEFEDRIVDNMAMQLVQKPELYEVIVTPNLYGDILSDLCAGLVGGLGIAPGANIGEHYAVFEPVHGSAPKYAGQNKVNPTATILSAVMMLRHLGEIKKADLIERCTIEVISEGKQVTYDIARITGSTPVGTSEMTDAIIKKIRACDPETL